MEYDFRDLQFCGLASEVAETEYRGSFSEDTDNVLVDSLLREYRQAKSPEDVRGWLTRRLSKVFVSYEQPPDWIEPCVRWPFLDGEPMAFIWQSNVGANKVAKDRLAPNVVLYVFGGRKKVDDGWEMVYTTVEQHQSLSKVSARRTGD
jgi:hypothetical protein